LRILRVPGFMLSRGLALLALLAFTLAAAGESRPALARGGKEKPGAGPMGGTIRDSATTLSVPLDDELSLVVGLPERFWLQCPRILPVPTSLAGRGLIAQYMNARGGSVSMLYLGCVPLSPAGDGLTLEQRAQHAAADFAVGLAKAYGGVEWELFSGPVAVAPTHVKVDGKKVSGWRAKRYSARPKDYGGPDSVFSGECALFVPPGQQVGSEQLAYIALDAKQGGTTLDKVLEQLAIKPTRQANPTGRRAQLNDLFESADAGRFPVRQIAFDLPAGFALTPAVFATRGEWVFIEERLGADGRPNARLQIRQRLTDRAGPPSADATQERGNHTASTLGPVEEVPLAVPGKRAYVFTHASTDAGASAASTAVVRVDDMILLLTWTTFGEGAAGPPDLAAFNGLVKSLDYAVRW